jgi:ribosomal protein S4
MEAYTLGFFKPEAYQVKSTTETALKAIKDHRLKFIKSPQGVTVKPISADNIKWYNKPSWAKWFDHQKDESICTDLIEAYTLGFFKPEDHQVKETTEAALKAIKDHRLGLTKSLHNIVVKPNPTRCLFPNTEWYKKKAWVTWFSRHTGNDIRTDLIEAYTLGFFKPAGYPVREMIDIALWDIKDYRAGFIKSPFDTTVEPDPVVTIKWYEKPSWVKWFDRQKDNSIYEDLIDAQFLGFFEPEDYQVKETTKAALQAVRDYRAGLIKSPLGIVFEPNSVDNNEWYDQPAWIEWFNCQKDDSIRTDLIEAYTHGFFEPEDHQDEEIESALRALRDYRLGFIESPFDIIVEPDPVDNIKWYEKLSWIKWFKHKGSDSIRTDLIEAYTHGFFKPIDYQVKETTEAALQAVRDYRAGLIKSLYNTVESNFVESSEHRKRSGRFKYPKSWRDLSGPKDPRYPVYHFGISNFSKINWFQAYRKFLYLYNDSFLCGAKHLISRQKGYIRHSGPSWLDGHESLLTQEHWRWFFRKRRQRHRWWWFWGTGYNEYEGYQVVKRQQKYYDRRGIKHGNGWWRGSWIPRTYAGPFIKRVPIVSRFRGIPWSLNRVGVYAGSLKYSVSGLTRYLVRYHKWRRHVWRWYQLRWYVPIRKHYAVYPLYAIKKSVQYIWTYVAQSMYIPYVSQETQSGSYCWRLRLFDIYSTAAEKFSVLCNRSVVFYNVSQCLLRVSLETSGENIYYLPLVVSSGSTLFFRRDISVLSRLCFIVWVVREGYVYLRRRFFLPINVYSSLEFRLTVLPTAMLLHTISLKDICFKGFDRVMVLSLGIIGQIQSVTLFSCPGLNWFQATNILIQWVNDKIAIKPWVFEFRLFKVQQWLLWRSLHGFSWQSRLLLNRILGSTLWFWQLFCMILLRTVGLKEALRLEVDSTSDSECFDPRWSLFCLFAKQRILPEFKWVWDAIADWNVRVEQYKWWFYNNLRHRKRKIYRGNKQSKKYFRARALVRKLRDFRVDSYHRFRKDRWKALRHFYAAKLHIQKFFSEAYGYLNRRQLYRYWSHARRLQSNRFYNWLTNLECRLSAAVIRFGFVSKPQQARQLICHSGVLVNFRYIYSMNYPTLVGDSIMLWDGLRSDRYHAPFFTRKYSSYSPYWSRRVFYWSLKRGSRRVMHMQKQNLLPPIYTNWFLRGVDITLRSIFINKRNYFRSRGRYIHSILIRRLPSGRLQRRVMNWLRVKAIRRRFMLRHGFYSESLMRVNAFSAMPWRSMINIPAMYMLFNIRR